MTIAAIEAVSKALRAPQISPLADDWQGNGIQSHDRKRSPAAPTWSELEAAARLRSVFTPVRNYGLRIYPEVPASEGALLDLSWSPRFGTV